MVSHLKTLLVQAGQMVTPRPKESEMARMKRIRRVRGLEQIT
jgi:hypothetical protein